MIQLDVTILGQPYKLACKKGEEGALEAAVNYLNGKMSAIRDAGKIKGTDRIAVMAALGLAAELLGTKAAGGPLADMTLAEIKGKISSMHTVIDAAITPQENLF